MPEISTLNENMVFILEKQNQILEASKEMTSEGKEYILKGIAAQFGKENNNNRIYEEGEYLPHLDYLKDKIKQKRLVGELDHPEKFDISLNNVSHTIEDLTHDRDGRTITIKVRLLDTPAGQIAKKLVDAGVPLSISSRAAGNVGPDKKVQIKKIFTYDLVADPGFQDAQLERVYESAGFSQNDVIYKRQKSVINGLECVNESLGLKNDNSLRIYNVNDNEEFKKIINKDKNKSTIMENTPNREFVSADDLNQYTMFLKKEMDAMKAEITSLRSGRVEEGQALSFNKPEPALGNGYNNGPSATPPTQPNGETLGGSMEDRVARLEKYSNYLAETLDGAIKYGEYLAENLDNSITYSKYLAENLDKNISYSKYLAENVDKSISYSEYVAENLDKSVEYSKYLAEKVDESIQYSEYVAEKVDTNISYSEYLAENLDRGISYSEYLAEKLDQGIGYSEYIAEKLDQGIGYTEYVAENLNKGIAYSEYLAENLNKGIAYSDYLAEKVKNNIAYSEYIAESVNNSLGDSINESAIEQADLASNAGLFESGFAGDYSTVSSKIDALIESVQTQKTETLTNKAAAKFQSPAQTQKADQVLNENVNENAKPSSGYKFIDEAPEEYAKVWESLNEGHKQSLIAQSAFYNLETPYQIKNFWSTRQLGRNIGLQKLVENENIETNETPATPIGYSNDYLRSIAQALEGKF
jgi:hypothetical protein